MFFVEVIYIIKNKKLHAFYLRLMNEPTIHIMSLVINAD